MTVPPSGYRRVGPAADYPLHSMTEVSIEGDKVLIAHLDEGLYATQARCPHLGGKLAHGKLNDTVITCPTHGSQFDAITGEVIKWTEFSGAIKDIAEFVRHPRPLHTYPTALDDAGDLWIGHAGNSSDPSAS